jgi:hypothetical protein
MVRCGFPHGSASNRLTIRALRLNQPTRPQDFPNRRNQLDIASPLARILLKVNGEKANR